MSTQEPNVPYGTTGERLKAFALNADARDRISGLAARYWEISAYAALVLCAAILRFYNLGARAMHHDESLHGYFSYGFTKGLEQFFTSGSATDGYQHVPFMHGPFQFIGSGFLMFIFGDGEFQARLLAAIMGTAMVFMPFLLRKQLGVFGALAAAALIAFSPTLMYYSRFTREDIYTAFWTFGIVIFMWRYLATKDNKFLYLTAGFMAGAFATKETTFMTVAAFIVFIDFLFALHLADKIRAKSPMDTLTYVASVIGLTLVAWLIAITWPFTSEQRAKYGLDSMPAEGNLLVVMGTLAVPQYAAAVQLPLGSVWHDRAYDQSDFNLHPDEASLAYVTIFGLIALTTLAGLYWNARTWLFAAAAFWVPFVLLFTTFFSNPEGFFSGMWGSMDYWISQQEVARGNQPEYYYFITIPVYEFLPLALSIAAGLYYAIRGKLTNALIIAGGMLFIVLCLVALPAGPEISKAGLFRVWVPFGLVLLGVMAFPMDHFNRFLIFWVVVTALALTVASEKMPWLNVHIAIGLAVLAGKFVGDIVQDTDLRDNLPKLERIAPFAYAAIAAALSILVFVIVGPNSPASIGAWALAVVAAVTVYWAFRGYSRRTAVQVALVAAVAAFTMFSLRAGVLASWGHPNNPYKGDVAERDYGEVPVELLVYTQTSGDIPVLARKVDEFARESGRGYDQPVVVDNADGFTWPWAWYLRKYRDVAYVAITDNYVPKANSILFISRNNATRVNLAGQYEQGIPYHHRRWFPEEYRGAGGVYSARDFFSDVFSVRAWRNWLDFWVRRTPPAAIGSADAVAYFPRGFVAVPVQPAGPTVRTEGTQLVIGGTGYAEGQMSQPGGVALDADGNLYVADTINNRIEKYDADGKFIASAGGFTSDFNFKEPWALAVAEDGSVFVADTWNHRIVKLSADLEFVLEWGSGGQVTAADDDPFKLFGPREIHVLPSGNVLIADTGNGRLVEYTPDGDFVRQAGSNGWNAEDPLRLNEPVGFALASNGDIYLVDFWSQRILVLDSAFAVKDEISVPSWGSQAVTDRAYIALLDDGRILTTDPANGRVLILAADGSSLGEYALPNEGAQATSRPVGIATDGTSLYVSDGAGNVVRKIPLEEVLP